MFSYYLNALGAVYHMNCGHAQTAVVVPSK